MQIPLQTHEETLTYALLACTLLATSASAGTFKVTNDEFSIASVNIPNVWKPEAIEISKIINSLKVL